MLRLVCFAKAGPNKIFWNSCEHQRLDGFNWMGKMTVRKEPNLCAPNSPLNEGLDLLRQGNDRGSAGGSQKLLREGNRAQIVREMFSEF